MKKVMLTAAALAVLTGGYLSYTTVDETTTAAVAAKPTYNATMYVAGMGGHFAVADVTIDPNDSKAPLKVNGMPGMLSIGNKKTHPTHDPRIDVNDRSVMYWSTYKLDPEGNLHVGKSDLKSGKKLVDLALPPDPRTTWNGANYCGSGQTEKYYMPVQMGNEGSIDIFSKEDMSLKHRVFFDDLGYKSGEYTFAHGTNSNNMKYFLLSLNLTPDGHTKFTGKTQMIMLDMKALEQGKIKKIAETTLPGKPKDSSGGSITFRQYFSQDDSLIFQSGADRAYVIDAKTLELLDVVTPLPGAAHDFIPTPDAKYAVLTLRERVFSPKDEGDVTDGVLALYDVKAKKLIGDTVSTCLTCHHQMGMGGSAILCGIDANWK